MKIKSASAYAVGLLGALLTACGSGGSPDSAASASPGNAGNSGCIDRSTAVGIEGGGLRRLLGTITSIGSDDTLVVGCQRISAGDAVVLVDGQPATLSDLEVGQIVEVLGSIDPESGNLDAERITGKVLPGSHGRYWGIVTIDGVDYFGDALLTVDGAIRLYVGGADGAIDALSGVLETTRPPSSAQLVGTFYVQEGLALGSGVIIGQGCATATPIRFCGDTASAEISLRVDPEIVQGEIQVTTRAGEETWLLDLGDQSNYYVLSADPQYLAGQYQEALAEFNVGADMIISVDSDGRLFFQSAPSSCVANGTLAPHPDGSFNVYDVELTLESCTGAYAYLNGAYEGFATTTPSSYWNYDFLLRAWLSKPDGASPAAAVTLLGFAVYPP
jgi:hypothetical protein